MWPRQHLGEGVWRGGESQGLTCHLIKKKKDKEKTSKLSLRARIVKRPEETGGRSNENGNSPRQQKHVDAVTVAMKARRRGRAEIGRQSPQLTETQPPPPCRCLSLSRVPPCCGSVLRTAGCQQCPPPPDVMTKLAAGVAKCPWGGMAPSDHCSRIGPGALRAWDGMCPWPIPSRQETSHFYSTESVSEHSLRRRLWAGEA